MSADPVMKESPKPGCPLLALGVALVAGILGGAATWLLAAVH